MPPKSNAIRERIKEFHSDCANADPVKIQATVKKALNDRNCLMVKHAAERCEERLIYDLEADLLKAYQRFLKNPVKNDPNCTAKGAIVRAWLHWTVRRSIFSLPDYITISVNRYGGDPRTPPSICGLTVPWVW
ncbi:hypothetical protein [Desulfosarcina cetonica]|uniref:hypothetical protein n=1 Tax=Desulfosarcina cetonica TaxID=90730 RepID=UPI001C438342|nr:hypothetical protein [Desulfosarcina cetonica]